VRLDVAVDHAAAVCELERLQGLHGVADGLRLGQRRALGDLLLERRPLDVLHRDVVGALGLAAVIDGDDVGMAEAGRGRRLAAEPLHEAGVAGVAVGQDLDRHPAMQGLVLRQVDVRHAAGSDPAFQPVAAVE
jgi:hypothetical protein